MYSDPGKFIKSLIAKNGPCSTLFTGVDGILRVYNFGEADQVTAGPPYVVLSPIGGDAYNFLSDAPTDDNLAVKVDIYAAKPTDCSTATRAVVSCIEVHEGQPDGVYVETWGGLGRDSETREFVSSFICSLVISRS